MAEKVYVVIRVKATEAWFQLSEEERKSVMEKAHKVRKDNGGEALANFPTYSSEWRWVDVLVFPDMAAYHKHTIAIGPKGQNLQRYFDAEITLGYERPA